MLEKKFQAVLEGADHDSPSIIQYCPLEISVPENATVLIVRNTKLLLYGRLATLGNAHSFTLVKHQDNSVRGLPLLDESTPNNMDWLGWVFEMPRSINTIDGRFYLNEVFFRPDWTYYFPLVEHILDDCNNFYSKRISEEKLRSIQRSAF